MEQLGKQEWWADDQTELTKQDGSWHKFAKTQLYALWKKENESNLERCKILKEYNLFRNKTKSKRQEVIYSTDRGGARIMLRLISGSSDLEVSKGRKIKGKNNKKKKERRCRVCGSKKDNRAPPETLRHFLLECPHYKNERK